MEDGSETLRLIGHIEALSAFQQAKRSGKLHHAWLLQGPQGIGKAQLARSIAALLLGASPNKIDVGIEFPRTEPIAHRVMGGSHPDLRSISREVDDKGKLPQDIPVDKVRALAEFFALKPALGGARVAIVDSLDEINRFGANALLKVLEEPPANGYIILISHLKQPVLPTIRSRCRTLQLAPLSDMACKRVLERQSAKIVPDIQRQAPGRPGEQLRLAEIADSALLQASEEVVSVATDDARAAEFLSVAGRSLETFEVAAISVLGHLSNAARTTDAPHRANKFAKLWLEIMALLSEVRDLNMDATQSAAALLKQLQKSA